MNRRRPRQAPVVGLAAVVLAVLIAQIALAGGSEKEPRATASAVSNKKFKKLKQQVSALQQQVDALARQPGPQGAQGPAGTAPACGGNGSGDTMVSAGAVCIDRYEISIWDAPEGGNQIIGDMPAPCTYDGQDCDNIFARSVPGVTPSASISYFQAQQALANVGKRLPTNAEWQQAVAGTPDPGVSPGAEDCNTSSGVAVATGSLDNCISNHGANDMVGNLWEWVGDWDEDAGGCASWPSGGFGDDATCIGQAEGDIASRFPAALGRGGHFSDGAGAGPFAVKGKFLPSGTCCGIGARGVR